MATMRNALRLARFASIRRRLVVILLLFLTVSSAAQLGSHVAFAQAGSGETADLDYQLSPTSVPDPRLGLLGRALRMADGLAPFVNSTLPRITTSFLHSRTVVYELTVDPLTFRAWDAPLVSPILVIGGEICLLGKKCFR